MGVGINSGLVTYWQIALGVGEPSKVWYRGVIVVLPVTIVTLDISMCEGVGE